MANDIEIMEPPKPPVEAVNPMALLQMAIASKYDPDSIGKLSALVEHWQERESRAAYFEAMRKCQAEMPAVVRDKKGHNNMYAPLEAVNIQIKPVYTRHGFSLSFSEDKAEKAGHFRMVVDIMHEAGHREQKWFEFPLDGTGAKGNANMSAIQAAGSTTTYARRYATCLVFNVTVADQDRDGAGWKDTLIRCEQDELNQLLEERDINRERFFAWVGAEKVEDILRDKFSAAAAMLRKKPMKGGAK